MGVVFVDESSGRGFGYECHWGCFFCQVLWNSSVVLCLLNLKELFRVVGMFMC